MAKIWASRKPPWWASVLGTHRAMDDHRSPAPAADRSTAALAPRSSKIFPDLRAAWSTNQTDEICLGISVSIDFRRPESMEGSGSRFWRTFQHHRDSRRSFAVNSLCQGMTECYSWLRWRFLSERRADSASSRSVPTRTTCKISSHISIFVYNQTNRLIIAISKSFNLRTHNYKSAT